MPGILTTPHQRPGTEAITPDLESFRQVLVLGGLAIAHRVKRNNPASQGNPFLLDGVFGEAGG
ncbi:hypothetical protein D3C84_640940 [compost metagenome]